MSINILVEKQFENNCGNHYGRITHRVGFMLISSNGPIIGLEKNTFQVQQRDSYGIFSCFFKRSLNIIRTIYMADELLVP